MVSVPFPVVTLLALFILLAMALFSGKPHHRGTVQFLSACILLLSVSMLRWEYDSVALRNLQAMMAVLLPSIAWHSFMSLTEMKRPRYLSWLVGPVIITLLIEGIWPTATDMVLFLLFFSYGCGLMWVAWRGDDIFIFSRLSESLQTTRMAFFAGCFLCISALTDLTIAFDFSMTGGRQAPAIVALFQAMLLPLIGFAIISAGRTTAVSNAPLNKEVTPEPPTQPAGEQNEIYVILEEKVRATQIYLNPDLTLNLLARKTGIPARQLSAAVNALCQCNVSQWINCFRIERAQALLLSSPQPVTEIMLDSGFTTKSNFNREFQRICGMSPTAFRQQARDNQATSSEIP